MKPNPMKPNPQRADTADGQTAAVTPHQEQSAVTATAPPRAAPSQPPSAAAPKGPDQPHSRKLILVILGCAGLALVCWFGIPFIILTFTTVSTDDAYVNSHVTAVAPRVDGQVTKVLVDDNWRVNKGDKLVLLDKEPLLKIVNIKKADLAEAESELQVTLAEVDAMANEARSNRFKLENAMENVRARVSQLYNSVSGLGADLAVRAKTKADFERQRDLMLTKGATTQQEADLKLQDYLVAKAKVRQSLDSINQIRAGLGLRTIHINADEITEPPQRLAETPDDLDQTFSAVRQAAFDMLKSAAPLGIKTRSIDLLPRQILAQFFELDPDRTTTLPILGASAIGVAATPLAEAPLLVATLYPPLAARLDSGAVDRIFKKIFKTAPAVIKAQDVIMQKKRDLEQAELNLSYTDVYAEIDGVVTRRNVNPGNNVKAGQSLMAIRSLTEIWIDANFKETQLAPLRIGQPVKIEVDMYGSRHEFEGRITGFTMGTGQTLALLPPQNATGNFVKIVQRLPVKIELIGYDPDKSPRPLFVGLSVTPYVHIYEPLVENDPGKGKFLQTLRDTPAKR